MLGTLELLSEAEGGDGNPPIPPPPGSAPAYILFQFSEMFSFVSAKTENKGQSGPINKQSIWSGLTVNTLYSKLW